jgi:hypothetical protein
MKRKETTPATANRKPAQDSQERKEKNPIKNLRASSAKRQAPSTNHNKEKRNNTSNSQSKSCARFPANANKRRKKTSNQKLAQSPQPIQILPLLFLLLYKHCENPKQTSLRFFNSWS